MVVSRRGIQFILGAIWFLDGILQLQPVMFSNQFISSMILPMAQSQPSWVADSIQWAANWAGSHEWIYNCSFASIQLVIGFWLMVNFRVKTALVAAFVWSFIVWWFGEGFGQLATGHALLLTGAPGAVLLYVMIGWVVWPSGRSDGDNSPGRRSIARYSLGLLWILGAVLQVQPMYRHSLALSKVFAAGWAGQVVVHLGSSVGIALGMIQLILGMILLIHRKTGVAVVVSIGLLFLFWWVGQSFGQLLTGMATDPNTGPLMILLALCTRIGTSLNQISLPWLTTKRPAESRA